MKNGRGENAWDPMQQIYKDEDMQQCVDTVVHSFVPEGFAAVRQPRRLFVVTP